MKPTPAIECFFEIADRMRELRGEAPYCPRCEDSGWECYAVGRNDPRYIECSDCGNHRGRPSP